MVHVDSHTISKSIDNDQRVDDIFDSITDLEGTRSPKQRRDRIQHKYRSDYKDEFVRPEYVFKDTKLYSDTDRTTQKASPTPSTEHSKHHKSPKRRVGSFWRKFRGKDKKIKHDNNSRSRRISSNREFAPKYTITAVHRSSLLKNKKKNNNPFTPRPEGGRGLGTPHPPDGKYVKRDLDTANTENLLAIAHSSTVAPTSNNNPYSSRSNSKLRIGITPQFDNMQKNKFRIKTVEPYKMTERVVDPLENSEATQSSDIGSLETLSTQLAQLKEKYGLTKATSTYTLSASKHRTETSTPKSTTATEGDFAGTAQIEALLDDIKMKAMARITQESPMVTDIITNTVTEATFEVDHLLSQATPGYNKDAIEASNDISNRNAKRTVSSEDENKIYLKDATSTPSTESHYVAARSIKEDTITMAHNVEDMLQRELKNIYNKVKHKVSSDFRKEINKAKCTIKEGLHKISTCGKCSNITTTKSTVRMTTPTKKAQTVSQSHKSVATEREKATSRHARNTPTLKTSSKSDLEFTKVTYDDYVMLTLYEEMLAKTHEENVRKMLATANVTSKKKRRHHIKLSKRNPETLTNVKLREVVEKLYDDGGNMPEYDYIEPSININMSMPSSDMPDLDSGSLEPVVVPDTVMAEPDQHIHNSVPSSTVSGTQEDLSDTSLEGLSNKISYNDFVNGYKHYLKFQKEQSNQNFSNLVKYQAHRHHSVDDIGKFILNKIPPLPSLRGKRFLDETDMDYQEITTKSDDSWFKKHFYLFIDNGPPKKFHTAQTVELKSAATEAPKTYVTNPMLPQPVQKDQVYISIGADEGQVGLRTTTMDTSSMNLEDLSKVLDSIKSKQTISPYLRGLKTYSKPYVMPNVTVTENAILQIRMMPQNVIGKLFGGNRRQAHPRNRWTYSDDWSPIDMFTETPSNRWKRTVKGSVTIMEDFINKDLEEKPTTGSKEVFAEPAIKTRETNKYGYVDIDLVPRQTAVVKLRENTKKSKFKNFFKRFRFKKSKGKAKQNKRSANGYYGDDTYGYGHRRSRFNPIKKLKDMFHVKPEPGKEESPVYNMPPNMPPNMPDYDMMTSHIDTFKPVKYDKPMSLDEMQRQIPNISDIDALATKPTTGLTSFHYRLDESDSALLSNDHASSPMPSLPEQKVYSSTPQATPQVLDLPTDWREAAVAITGQTVKTAQKDPTPLTSVDKTTTSATTKSTTITTQATTTIRPTEDNVKKTNIHFNKITKTLKTTVQQRQPPNNVMTVNLKTLKTPKTKSTRVSKVTKRSTTTMTSTFTTTTTPAPPPTTQSTEVFKAEPAQLFRTSPSDLFDRYSTDLFDTEAPHVMTLDDINLILRNIQHKLQKFTSTEYPKISTNFFKRGTMYGRKNYNIPVSIPKPPREIEELTVKTKLTRIAKFPITKRQYKVKNVQEIPVHDQSDYPDYINDEHVKEYPRLRNRNSVADMKVAGKHKQFYSSTPKERSGKKKYTDFFNDLLMWHNDILNLDKVPSPVWNDILNKVQANTVESYTTPNMTDILKELKEMKEYLAEADLASVGTANHSQKMEPLLQMAYTDMRRRPKVHKQGMIQSVAMDDNAIVTSKDFLIRGEAKYYQYNRPGLIAKKIKSSDFITKLDRLGAYDDEKISKDVPRHLDPSSPFYDTKEPAILVDTTLMAYDDDADSITKGLEVKKLSRDSQKSNKVPKKHGQAFTPFLKTNKPPMQYFTTPLPMKSNEFNKFLKEHMMDVESVTSPTLELPTFNNKWVTRPHKYPTSTALKSQAAVTKASVQKLAKIDSLKKLNSELLKSINYTSQLMVKAKPADHHQPSPRPQANSKKDSFVDDFDRQKRYSEVSKVPRVASVKTDKVTHEANYYNMIKKKMKERLFEKKGTPAERPSLETVTLDPRNKEVEITIINFDDIEKLTTPQTYETYALPAIKKEDSNLMTIPPYSTELDKTTMTTPPPTTSTTEFGSKFDFGVKDEMHNGLLYKDIFREHDKTTTTSTEFSTQDSKSTTEYVDPSMNETPSTTKIRYPFEKIPQLYPNILGKMPHVKNFNAAPKRVQISSHHYKYDIFYDDTRKIMKSSGFDYHTKDPMDAVAVGNKRSQLRDNIVVLRHPSAPVRGKQGTSMNFGKRSQLKDNYPRAPTIFRKGETKIEVIRKIDRTAKRTRHIRRVSDTEVTRKHRLFTWRGCKPKPSGGLSAPGENPEDQYTEEARSSLNLGVAAVSVGFPNSDAVTVGPDSGAVTVGLRNVAASVEPDITILREVSTQRDVAIMAAITGSPTAISGLAPSSPVSASVSALTASMAASTEGTPQRGSLIYDLKHLRRTSASPANKDKSKDKDRHRRLFKLSALLHDKFKSLVKNLTTAKRADTTISTTKHATKADSKSDSTQTTQHRAKKKEKEEDRDDLKAEGISITCGPKENKEQKEDLKCTKKHPLNPKTTTTTTHHKEKETEVETEATTETQKPHYNKCLDRKGHVVHDLPNEPIYIEPDNYSEQEYYELGPQHHDPTPPPPPCPAEATFFGNHIEIKRDLQTQQNTFTAKDVAALEVIVDLMKNTLSYEEKDIASVFQTNNYMALPHATKSIHPSNESTNAIQVHIAIPFDFQTGKKRSPLDPVRVRKVFSAKMSTPVDLEYQVHSFEGTVDPTTESTVTTTNKSTTAAVTSHVSVEGALSPGMYLLVDKPKSGFALKPIKGKINLSDLKTRQVPATTASMSESKPTETREETKSIARVTLSKDFIAAFNKQLIQMYENVSRATLEHSNKPRNERQIWKSREIKAVTEEYTGDEEKYVFKRRIDWDAVKKYFGHDRVCNCKCKTDKAMCKACAASDAVIDELIFEFDNIGQYMKDHCTEIQTFFWMNPGGGQKLRDSVSRIDKSLADYYKRVRGKCQGRTCKTFTTYIDKRQLLVKTSKETRPDSLTHMNSELAVLADDLDKTVSLQACFNQKLIEEGDKFINILNKCIMKNSIEKRSNTPQSPPKKKLIKNVYSLDNINVNIICNPESPSSSESFEHTSSLAPHQDITSSHLNDPLFDYVLAEPKHKKRKGLKKLFPRKSKKKFFTYYTSDYTKRPRLHFKRQVNYGMMTPLISDGGGAFWYDYIKPSTNEPRVARESKQDKSIQIAVVQKEANGAPKIQKIMDKSVRHPSSNSLFMTVKTTPKRDFRDTETTIDYLTHNINQLLQLFGSLQDIETMNKNSNRSTMFLNHTAKLKDDQTSKIHTDLDKSTLEKKSTKCIKKVKTKMHYKTDTTTEKPTTTTLKAKTTTTTQQTTLTTEHTGKQSEENDKDITLKEKQMQPNIKEPVLKEKQIEQHEKESELKEKQSGQNEKQFEQNYKPPELKDKQFEQNDKLSEIKDKQFEQNDKPSELKDKSFEQKDKQFEPNDKQSDQIDKPSELKEKPSELKDKQFELNDKPSEQIEKPSEIKEKPFEQGEKQTEQNDKQSDLREKQIEQSEKQPDQIDKPAELRDKQSGQIDKQFEQNDKPAELKGKQIDQNDKTSEEIDKQFDANDRSDGVTTSLDTNFDSLDTLESKIENGTSNCKTTNATANTTAAPEPKKPNCKQKCPPNPLNASDTIIIRDTTSLLMGGKSSKDKTTKLGSISTTITPAKKSSLQTTTTKKDEFADPKAPVFEEGETTTQVTTTTTTSRSFLGKLKTATLKFFDSVTHRPKHPQKTVKTTTVTTTETTLSTRAIDKISSTETDPMYFDDTQVTTRISPTIVIINEYDNQINSDILDDPNKDVNGYRNLLLSIIQYETNKLNDEWHRIAYGDTEEVGLKRSVSQINRQTTTTTTTKSNKKPKLKVATAADEEYDVIEGMKALKNLEIPEPTAKTRKPAGLLNKIVNKMGIKVVTPEKKQAVKKPTLREVGSRKKLNRKRRLKLNSWKMEPSTMPDIENRQRKVVVLYFPNLTHVLCFKRPVILVGHPKQVRFVTYRPPLTTSSYYKRKYRRKLSRS
ncbi:unnamed protein product [Spodoptera littoralis]|uniref:Uncharacterized protein n=1 Tax=Spodoptera littoralis TaxID=7109 RepID=A0A9P0N638_SPOLI|nr:unnamed protein product [Spodoptera littoralis]CAH1642874.1 unnamed protein product [Spodoptera littoralis]